VFRCREEIRSTPLPRARRRDADEVDEHADSGLNTVMWNAP
jgi:hypothetical protein